MKNPAPVAVTACRLMQSIPAEKGPYQVADIASRLHRLAKGAQRASVMQCNGEIRDGQRNAIYRQINKLDQQAHIDDMEAAIVKYCDRVDKQIEKLSAELAPFGYTCARNGDPRGFALRVSHLNGSDAFGVQP